MKKQEEEPVQTPRRTIGWATLLKYLTALFDAHTAETDPACIVSKCGSLEQVAPNTWTLKLQFMGAAASDDEVEVEEAEEAEPKPKRARAIPSDDIYNNCVKGGEKELPFSIHMHARSDR